LLADFVDAQGKKLKSVADSVSVGKLVRLEQTIRAPTAGAKVSLRLIDAGGQDRGELGNAPTLAEGRTS
jgi:hypothetical protein